MQQILTYVGITAAAQRTVVIADLMPNPEKLGSLLDETKEGIEDACASYNKLPEGDRFRLSRVVIKRLVGLMFWVKDQERLSLPLTIPNGTDQAQLLKFIRESVARQELRNTQKKMGENLITSSFDTNLKNRSQWERWCTELKALLNTIIGARGIALSYVIRDPSLPVPTDFDSYEEQARWTGPHTGMQFDLDKKAVHNIIIRNIAESSDAYIYLKPSIKQEDGAADIRLLRDRYDNDATKQQRINEANNSLKNLTYKNERSMTFEKFSGLLKKAVDTLDECGRKPHNGDLVDGLWARIQNPQLMPYINALKVQYQMNGRTFQELLQDIASQIPNLTQASGSFRNTSQVNTSNNNSNPIDLSKVTESGPCPNVGAYTDDGKLFVGTYFYGKWNSPSVRPHHNKIRKARDKLNATKRNNNKHGGNSKWKRDMINKNRRTVASLQAQIEELRSQAGGSNNTSTNTNNNNTNNNNSNNNNSNNNNRGSNSNSESAGNAFGGRSSRHNSNNNSNISQIVTSSRTRLIAPINVSHQNQHEPNFTAKCELDSHADTIVAGGNCLLLNHTDRACTVHAYDQSLQPKSDVPIVKAATGFTSRDGRNYILVFNEALWMPNLNHSLINPNQLRENGVEVQDNPYASAPMTINTCDEEFRICLESKGTTIYFSSWLPSLEDLSTYPHIIMSSDREWNPLEIEFPNSSYVEMLEIESRNVAEISSTKDAKCQGHCDCDTPIDADQDNIIYNPIAICRRIINSVRVHPVRYDITLPTYVGNVSRVATVEPQISTGKILREAEVQPQRTFISKDRHSNMTPEDLSERWGISVAQAALTLKATTRRLLRSAVMPIARRYRVDRMFGIRRLNCPISSDTMDARCRSIFDQRYCQVFASKEFFVEAYPISQKSECHEPLKRFVKEYGSPYEMITDGSKEQCGRKTEFASTLRKYDIYHKIIEPERHNQNPCEGVIRELRKRWYRTIFKSNCPRSLWNYGIPHCAAIMSRTASYAGNLNGRTPLEHLTGETVDISEYLDFGFWDRVWFKDDAGIGETKLARFLGISHQVGSLMSYWVLPQSGIPESRTTVQRVTVPESNTEANKARFVKFDQKIAERFKEDRLSKSGDKPNLDDYQDLISDDCDFADEFNRVFSNADVKEVEDDHTLEQYDKFLNMDILIDRGDEYPELGRVIKRARNSDGVPIGTANDNPILDTRMYHIEFQDGHSETISANIIAENLFSQVDQEGRRYAILDQIIEVRRDGTEVQETDAFLTTQNNIKRRRKTTRGWEVCILWKDKSTTWHALKDIKDSYPVELAEFAVENGISHLPAFAWWVPFTLRKRDRIVSKIKSKYWVRTHKYGIRIPKTVQEAIEIDRENNNTLWWDALMLEMKNVRPAFEVFDKNIGQLPIGYTRINCHVIWDVKLGENFRRKARFVAGGHQTQVPPSLTYSSVVSRDSVRIALTIAALNGLDILSCDIQNAYLSAECREKVYTVAGPEFGTEEGTIMIIKMALYGLKSSGAAFRSKLASVIWDMGYRATQGDPDVWIRPSIDNHGVKYYEMILCYVDDVLSISHDPSKAIEGIQKVFKLKGDRAETPKMYLGCSLALKDNGSGKKCWTMSSHEYVKQSIMVIEEKLSKKGRHLPKRCITPLTGGYHPSVDTSPELDAEETQFYQECVGILRWAVELGRVDILLEVALMSQYLANPRRGHLDQIYHIFGYLSQVGKRTIYLDPDYPDITQERFAQFDWTDFYAGAKEPISPNAPEPRGRPIDTHAFVDSDHGGDKITRRSQTGLLIFCNRAPIIWLSKRQNSVQNSTFGAEFCALKHAVEIIEALRFKLRSFGVPIEEAGSVYCDNEAVFKNVSIPISVLSKKHHSVAYHFCRQAVAMGMIKIAKECSGTNLADLFTKVLPRATRERLLDMFTY